MRLDQRDRQGHRRKGERHAVSLQLHGAGTRKYTGAGQVGARSRLAAAAIRAHREHSQNAEGDDQRNAPNKNPHAVNLRSLALLAT